MAAVNENERDFRAVTFISATPGAGSSLCLQRLLAHASATRLESILLRPEQTLLSRIFLDCKLGRVRVFLRQ